MSNWNLEEENPKRKDIRLDVYESFNAALEDCETFKSIAISALNLLEKARNELAFSSKNNALVAEIDKELNNHLNK